MKNYKTIHENASSINPFQVENLKRKLERLKDAVKKLERKDLEDGEYIKLEEVLKLL